MIDITYDPEADAVYIYPGRAEVDRTEEAGPFIYDVDVHGRVRGIEILSASQVLSPGEWQNARLRGASKSDAAE
jgi:uncharacterized protein YuzE